MRYREHILSREALSLVARKFEDKRDWHIKRGNKKEARIYDSMLESLSNILYAKKNH